MARLSSHTTAWDYWPEYSEDAEGDEGAAEILVVSDAESDVVRHDGDEVDDTHDACGMLAASRCRVQPQQVLRSEYQHAGRVQTEERVWVPLTASHSDAGHQTTTDRLGNVCHHRRRDEKPA